MSTPKPWYVPPFPVFYDIKPYDAHKSREVLCTCGGDKTYGPEANLHVDWCDKAPPPDTERSR